MLHTSITPTVANPLPLPSDRSRDYELIRRAIAFLSETWAEQPSLDRLADHLQLSPAHCQKLFKRWCGLSPKEFVQAITVDHARGLLEGSASVLDAAYQVGLSGGSRLHDLFVSHEAMTPGDYKRRGEGLEMAYGFHASPFGEALLIATERGLAGLAFVDEDKGQTRQDALADMMQRWPKAHYVEAPAKTAPHARQIFGAHGEQGPARAPRHDRHRLRCARVGDAAQDPHGPGGELHRHRPPYRHPVGLARRGLGRRPQPDLVRGALPSRAARRRQPRRLPLGPHPQARPDRLGDGARGGGAGLRLRALRSARVAGYRGQAPV